MAAIASITGFNSVATISAIAAVTTDCPNGLGCDVTALCGDGNLIGVAASAVISTGSATGSFLAATAGSAVTTIAGIAAK